LRSQENLNGCAFYCEKKLGKDARKHTHTDLYIGQYNRAR